MLKTAKRRVVTALVFASLVAVAGFLTSSDVMSSPPLPQASVNPGRLQPGAPDTELVPASSRAESFGIDTYAITRSKRDRDVTKRLLLSGHRDRATATKTNAAQETLGALTVQERMDETGQRQLQRRTTFEWKGQTLTFEVDNATQVVTLRFKDRVLYTGRLTPQEADPYKAALKQVEKDNEEFFAVFRTVQEDLMKLDRAEKMPAVPKGSRLSTALFTPTPGLRTA